MNDTTSECFSVNCFQSMLKKFLFAIIAFMKLFKLEDTEYKGREAFVLPCHVSMLTKLEFRKEIVGIQVLHLLLCCALPQTAVLPNDIPSKLT